jgi:hypothetical protein
MTRQPTPPLEAQSEQDLIVARVATRLDRLSAEASTPEAVARIEEADAAYHSLSGACALDSLLAMFDCSEADRMILLTCLACEFDPRLLARYEQITGRAWATEWLASILFARPGQVLLTEGSALLRWRLVRVKDDQPGEPAALTADPAIRNWLAGIYEIPMSLSAKMRFQTVLAPLEGWPVRDTAERLARSFERRTHALLMVTGLEGAGRASFVANVADALGQSCLTVDPGTDPKDWSVEEGILAHRLALVCNAVLLWRRSPPASSLAPINRHPPALQAVTLAVGETPPEPGPLAPFEITLPPMPPHERAAMIAAQIPTADRWSKATVDLLSTREALTPAAIARLARIAPEQDAQAIEDTNFTQAAVMGSLAERMTGDVSWHDLILPDALSNDLHDLAYEARTRRHAWAAPEMARLFARERGLVGLFHGPPGTGKTMAAQVVAREMGVDLYRIDCGTVVSKYIGETSKNLGAIFARARQIDAVLFFDEADALFSRRTDPKDSNDRHANSDTTQLLQLIEGQFEGTALLATNRKGDMDAAFLRRIRYSFDFPRPAVEARIAIWQRAATALCPDRAAALEGLWPILGTSLEITGAQIKTTLLSAWFAAARQEIALSPACILRAADRELMKEGRALGARERERIRAYA